jgi:hypothetical protein
MDESQLRRAFSKVKADMESLRKENILLKKHISILNDNIKGIQQSVSQTDTQTYNKTLNPADNPTQNTNKDTFNSLNLDINKADKDPNSAFRQIISTDFKSFKPLKPQKSSISIGNDGVPTVSQSVSQTDKQSHFSFENPQKVEFLPSKYSQIITEVDKAAQIIESLDAVKRSLRRKFKQITEQEFLIFSTIYQLESTIQPNSDIIIDYKLLSSTLKLSESSIRDYVSRLVKKGIPVDKIKFNNKKIHLSISPNLKKLATLDTIMHLREL